MSQLLTGVLFFSNQLHVYAALEQNNHIVDEAASELLVTPWTITYIFSVLLIIALVLVGGVLAGVQ